MPQQAHPTATLSLRRAGRQRERLNLKRCLSSSSVAEQRYAGFVPAVSFFFRDHTRSVSEEAADFLVAQLEVRSETSETAAALAERLATEEHRGRFAPPGQDLVLDHDEQHELQLALADATIQAE